MIAGCSFSSMCTFIYFPKYLVLILILYIEVNNYFIYFVYLKFMLGFYLFIGSNGNFNFLFDF